MNLLLSSVGAPLHPICLLSLVDHILKTYSGILISDMYGISVMCSRGTSEDGISGPPIGMP